MKRNTERVGWLAVGLAALVACAAKEPVGTPVALERQPDNKSDEEVAWTNLGIRLDHQNRVEESLFAVRKAVELARHCAGPVKPECKGNIEKANPPGAMGDLATSLVWKRRLCDALTSQGIALNRLGQPKFALKPLDEAIALEPDHPYHLEAKGDAHFDLHEWQAAHDAYVKAATMEGRVAYQLARAGVAKLRLGDRDAASKLLEEGLSKNRTSERPLSMPSDVEAASIELGVH